MAKPSLMGSDSRSWSTDDVENWDCVLNEGGVDIAIERIKRGFAAITANTQLMGRNSATILGQR